MARRVPDGDYPAGVDKLYDGLAEAPLVVPVQLTQYLMRKGGQGPILYNSNLDEREYNEDMRMAQVISFAAQRFMANILNDAMQHHKLRRMAGQKALKEIGVDTKDPRRVLRTEDLTQALLEHGVDLRPPPYYVDADKPQAAPQQAQAEEAAAAAARPKPPAAAQQP